MATTDLPISLLNGTIISGTHPLILIGANGVGKTRLGTALVQSFGYDRIPALRSLSFEASIPIQRAEDAKREANNNISRTLNNPWTSAEELTNVLSEMKADDAQYSADYRDKAETTGVYSQPVDTSLKKLVRIWKLVFPGRHLDLSTYNPRAKWEHGTRATEPYNANQMSDGERSALYLIARLLRAKPGIVLVDEPEVHFHALLARAFWDLIETERSDCRFIYITHDIPFALSRAGARIGIVKSASEVDLVPEDAPIPAHLYESILGAASLSVVANRIIFCEGKFDRSIDIHLYSAWFRSPASVVVPVGSCADVQKSVEVFSANPTIANAAVLGIVERDYWPDGYLSRLATEPHLAVLPAHEIEGLLCLRGVATAVANYLAVNAVDAAYAKFEDAVRKFFVGTALHKQILERAKRQIDVTILGLPNKAHVGTDLAGTRAKFVQVVDLSRAIPDVGAVFDAETARIQTVIASNASDFLAILPGKDCLDLLCKELGVSKTRYRELIQNALELSDNDQTSLSKLRDEVVAALGAHLPPR